MERLEYGALVYKVYRAVFFAVLAAADTERGRIHSEHGREFTGSRYRYRHFKPAFRNNEIRMVAAGPMLIVFPFFQKYFAKGLTVGAVKG